MYSLGVVISVTKRSTIIAPLARIRIMFWSLDHSSLMKEEVYTVVQKYHYSKYNVDLLSVEQYHSLTAAAFKLIPRFEHVLLKSVLL